MNANERLQNHPYGSFIRDVEKPARYVGGEYQSVEKPRDSVDVSICLALPDIYDIGMSHLGTKLLYKIINKEPNFAAERVFAPWIDMAAELRKRDLPLLSLETARPLKEFDVLETLVIKLGKHHLIRRMPSKLCSRLKVMFIPD